jgi:predicted GIY-YIG superfamily endonuclease
MQQQGRDVLKLRKETGWQVVRQGAEKSLVAAGPFKNKEEAVKATNRLKELPENSDYDLIVNKSPDVIERPRAKTSSRKSGR